MAPPPLELKPMGVESRTKAYLEANVNLFNLIEAIFQFLFSFGVMPPQRGWGPPPPKGQK